MEVTSAPSDSMNGGAWSQTQAAWLQSLHPPHPTRGQPSPSRVPENTFQVTGLAEGGRTVCRKHRGSGLWFR